MKQIGVLIENVAVDYSIEAAGGVCDFFADKDASVTIFPVRTPYAAKGDYNYQFWTGTKFASMKYFDAVIVISGGFLSYMQPSELGTLLKDIDDSRLISVAVPFPGRNIHYTKVDCAETYKNIVKHLIEKHGCKRIAHNSAELSGSTEAIERLEAYKSALKENGLEFDPDLVVPGNFIYESSYNIYKEKYKRKEDVDFDAVLCASDAMAFGCIDALREIGVDIPGDVKVIGYDDSDRATKVCPTLSTVNQQIYKQGYAAAELAYKIACGEKTELRKNIDIEPVYRQSCGCVPLDQFEKVKQIYGDSKLFTMNDIINAARFQDTVNYFLDRMQNTEKFDIFCKKLDEICAATAFKSVGISFFEQPVLLKQGEDFVLPKKAILSGIVERDKFYGQSCSHEFDPTEKLIPENVFAIKQGVFIFHPIFNGDKLYGYMHCRIDERSFGQHHIFLKIFAHGIALAYEYSKSSEQNLSLSIQNELLQIKNTALDRTSRTDELTSILNRRGIIEMGQKIIDFSLEINQTGVVFFGDMDHLKMINDTYGHEMGDAAIKTQADIFKSVFRSNDVIGRLSGDEFVAVAPGLAMEQVAEIRKKVQKKAVLLSKERNLPFELSISLGAVEFNEGNYELMNLIKEADAAQYEEKRKHHAERKN